MKINDIFPSIIREGRDDADHFDALDKTGFFGKAGAGCVIAARDTGRFLISHRSDMVEQPGTWGTWGGAIDSGEDPSEAVKREVHEETVYTGSITVEPLFIFKKGTFKYYNFLVIVDKEFKPRLDWENQGFKWCEYGKWPTPLHFGLISLLNDSISAKKMQEFTQKSVKKSVEKPVKEDVSLNNKVTIRNKDDNRVAITFNNQNMEIVKITSGKNIEWRIRFLDGSLSDASFANATRAIEWIESGHALKRSTDRMANPSRPKKEEPEDKAWNSRDPGKNDPHWKPIEREAKPTQQWQPPGSNWKPNPKAVQQQWKPASYMK